MEATIWRDPAKLDPAVILPTDGVKEVLIQAAIAHPLTALLLVGIILCVAWCATCWVIVKIKQLDVMQSPEAARAMVELKKIETQQKRLIAKLKKSK